MKKERTMIQPVTLLTGQFCDIPFEELLPKVAAWGYDGVELACKGDHFDVERGANDKAYCEEKLALLKKHGLSVWALSNHRCGHLVCDCDDFRTDGLVPERLRGDPEAKRKWGAEQMKLTAKAAKNMGAGIVTGFTGSPIWQYVYPFPAVPESIIEEGYRRFAELWNPVLDVFAECGVKFALEVHPAEIAYDHHSAARTLDAIKHRPEFGFNFDPSHLFWQMLDPVMFLEDFRDRIFHVHVKDCALTLNGRNGILCSHLNFGDRRRGWDFRSAGHGKVNFGEIFGALHAIGHTGPLSVEWEDSRMDREWGAADACRFVRRKNFPPSGMSLDAALGNNTGTGSSAIRAPLPSQKTS